MEKQAKEVSGKEPSSAAGNGTGYDLRTLSGNDSYWAQVGVQMARQNRRPRPCH